MSEAAPGDAWQREELATSFLDERQTLLPLLDVQEELVRLLFERHPQSVERFLDLGAGDGAAAELVLSVRPDAEAVLLDFSEPMLARAQRRFAGSAWGWQAISADLSNPSWSARLPAGDYGAAVSSFAIHHLPAERKRALFAELYALLAPGAMFVNMDVVTVEGPLAGLFEERMVANAIRAEHEHGGGRADEEVAGQLLDDSGDDRPDSAEDQLRWLREAGFETVQLHFKWAEGAIFGAVKPL